MARRVATILALEGVQQVVSGFKTAATAATGYASTAAQKMTAAGGYLSKHSADLEKMGDKSMKIGLAAGASLGVLAKAAMDWQSAWAGVTKTVDGSSAEMAALEADLRKLAKTLPASHKEIAAVAEAAGQLGVKRDDVAKFTKTMIDLGETTNLTSDEAATSLQQLMNIMGTAGKNVDRLGSAVVALGNEGASTERDIVQMGLRIAAAGNQIGLSESDVLAFAGTLASLGVPAEAGGTAISMAFKKIDGAVREGGAAMTMLAKTSGMSADEFRRAWAEDAAGATAKFVEGLGAAQTSGEDLNAILGELGIKGVRETDALIRMAGATKAAGSEQSLLVDQLALGRQAWQENNALVAEASKRYETTAAKASVAWNNIKDSAITMGQNLLPVLEKIMGAVAGLAEGFGNLSPNVQRSILGLLAVVAVAGTSFGALLKLATSLSNASAMFTRLGISAKTASLSMGAIGIALTLASVALGSYLGKQADSKARADAYRDSLDSLTGAITDNTRAVAAKNLQDVGALDAAEKLGISAQDMTSAVLGQADALERVNAALETHYAAWDEARGAISLTSDQYVELPPEVTAVSDALRIQRGELADVQGKQLQLIEANKQSADASKGDAEAKAKQKREIQEQKVALDDLISVTQAYGNALLQMSGSQIGVESAIADANAALETNGRNIDLTTAAGRANQQALNALASSSMQYIKTLAEQGRSQAEQTAATDRAKQEYVRLAVAMGYSEEEARAQAEAFYATVPAADEAAAAAANVSTKVNDIPGAKHSHIYTVWHGADEVERAKRGIQSVQGKTVYVTTYQQAVNLGTRGPVAFYEADGGILRSFASGGVEKHVAQIAPAGAMRLWAEPETGGEAYIPLAASKRARSREIWWETGKYLGILPNATGNLYRPVPSVNVTLPDLGLVDRGARISVVNHYPQAEPTSVTVNRAQQFAAAIGES